MLCCFNFLCTTSFATFNLIFGFQFSLFGKNASDSSHTLSNIILLTCLSQSRRLSLLQVVSNNKSFSVGVQSPTEINAPRGCAVILGRICQLSLTRITHQVSRAFDLNFIQKFPTAPASDFLHAAIHKADLFR